MTRPLYLVSAERGCYSDTWWEPLAAFANGEQARRYAERFEAYDREGCYRERAEGRVGRELASCHVGRVTLWEA